MDTSRMRFPDYRMQLISFANATALELSRDVCAIFFSMSLEVTRRKWNVCDVSGLYICVYDL